MSCIKCSVGVKPGKTVLAQAEHRFLIILNYSCVDIFFSSMLNMIGSAMSIRHTESCRLSTLLNLSSSLLVAPIL